jgi:hypothetical protein
MSQIIWVWWLKFGLQKNVFMIIVCNINFCLMIRNIKKYDKMFLIGNVTT